VPAVALGLRGRDVRGRDEHARHSRQVGGGRSLGHRRRGDDREGDVEGQARRSTLSLVARSRRYDPPFSKSLVRFTAPADLAGAGFLQIQKRDGDDDRFLFLPELKRSRRIAGNLRGTSFMGTDFSFADLDRRDLRESNTTKLPDENVGPHACFRLQTTPKRSDSPYSLVELWVRKDNYLPLKMKMYDRAKVLFKTFTAQEVRRISGRWYITKSRMVDHVQTHETELVIENIAPATDIADDEFTVRNLEKL
jgi:hypothetical protein